MDLILDMHGNPVSSAQKAPKTERAVQIGGGVMPRVGLHQMEPDWHDGTAHDSPALTGRFGLSRQYCRRISRALYFSNGLFRAAVDIAGAFLVGDNLTYGRFADEGLKNIVEDFWEANSFGELVNERLIGEWFLDGEVAVVFPSEANGDRLPTPNEPSRIGMLDVDLGGFQVDATTARGATAGAMVERLRLETANVKLRWEEGNFAWAAHMGAMWNDPRGWSLAYPAADFAVSYIALLNMRMNVHQVQQRLLAVYKAILDPNGVNANGDADGGAYEWSLKTRGLGQMPEQGGFLPVAVRPGYTEVNPVTGAQTRYDGVEESLDFMRPAQGAADAASDMRHLLRMVGLTIGGLPEHYLGEGGNATRTTAASMGLPSVRLSNKRQAALGSLLTRIFRAEVKRRAGPDAKFRVVKSRKHVHIDKIELPWVFPEIREETMDEIVKRVQLALTNGLISSQTATSDLGYDPALEGERLSGQAPKPQPGKPSDTPSNEGGA